MSAPRLTEARLRPLVRVVGSTWHLALLGGAVGLAGLGAVWIGHAVDPRQASFSYLGAYATVASAVVGALVLLFVGHVTGARWLVAVRRPVEALAATAPLLALLFVPIALALPELYAWTAPGLLEGEERELVLAKASWLEPRFFLMRAAFYLGTWSVLGALLWRWTRASDRGDPERSARRARFLAAAGFPLLGVTGTFATFDWLMSLEPAWHSSIYGVYFLASGFLAALSIATLAAFAWQRRGLLPGVSAHHFHALGRLLLTALIFWAYMAYSQGLIVWIADLPRESAWYVARTSGGWGSVLAGLGLAGFVAPFLALLPRSTKTHPARLAAVAGVLLAAHAVHVHWLVLPVLHPAGPRPCWIDLAALAGVGGVVFAGAAILAGGVAAAPARDPAFEASLRYGT